MQRFKDDTSPPFNFLNVQNWMGLFHPRRSSYLKNYVSCNNCPNHDEPCGLYKKPNYDRTYGRNKLEQFMGLNIIFLAAKWSNLFVLRS